MSDHLNTMQGYQVLSALLLYPSRNCSRSCPP